MKVSRTENYRGNLAQSVTLVKGVGEERAADLSHLGIFDIQDLLFYLPTRYEDRHIQELTEAKHDEKVTLKGIIQSEAVLRFYGRKKSRLSFKVLIDDRYLVSVIMFNRHYAKNQFTLGKAITMTGKLDKNRMQLTVSDYHFGNIQKEESTEGIIPVYSVSGSISAAYLRKVISQAIKQFGMEISEIIPDKLLVDYKLMPRAEAVKALHHPNTFEEIKSAKRRMIYEEFFLFQLKMQALRKVHREHQGGTIIHMNREKVEAFAQTLPFSLTNAQQRVLTEIYADMTSPYSMNRLLQGDVGSGKTIVAALSLYAAITAGFQGALMVPTEILAEQHYESLTQLFKNTSLNIALLTGSSRTAERRDILAGLQMGIIDILVGTHALIQDDVYFKNLGLVVIDEQHRFGVNQRRKLREKGAAPDVLFMTATPIPRTLAITAFGDMDVSIIDQLPAGRKPVETYWAKNEMLDRVIQFMAKELAKGRQAYFICPLIEESEKLDLQNAVDFHLQLSNELKDFHVGLLHGRMASTEKDEVMRQFTANQLQVLVSTTVIEVGVNVPNATLMVIQDAERFGLSQLHQLRGRVGRGSNQSYCILIGDPKTETGKERMRIMQQTNDGFEVAQKDLEIRGPGDFFGTKQSGLPEFKLADMIHDYKALEVARKDAALLIESESFWLDPKYEYLRGYLREQGVLESVKLD